MPYCLYVIEKRNQDGSLDFSSPQPEDYFGIKAIIGITENEIADVVFAHNHDIPYLVPPVENWAKIINPAFKTRRKTW